MSLTAAGLVGIPVAISFTNPGVVMRARVWVLAAAWATAGGATAEAQSGTVTGSVGTVGGATGGANRLTAGFDGQAMPGQAIGTGFQLPQVGTRAGAPVGKPINVPDDNPMMRRYDPSKPYDVFKGTGLDPKNLVTPIAETGQPGNDLNLMQRLYRTIGTNVGFFEPPAADRKMVTPGIFRRNRERAAERAFRRD